MTARGKYEGLKQPEADPAHDRSAPTVKRNLLACSVYINCWPPASDRANSTGLLARGDGQRSMRLPSCEAGFVRGNCKRSLSPGSA